MGFESIKHGEVTELNTPEKNEQLTTAQIKKIETGIIKAREARKLGDQNSGISPEGERKFTTELEEAYTKGIGDKLGLRERYNQTLDKIIAGNITQDDIDYIAQKWSVMTPTEIFKSITSTNIFKRLPDIIKLLSNKEKLTKIIKMASKNIDHNKINKFLASEDLSKIINSFSKKDVDNFLKQLDPNILNNILSENGILPKIEQNSLGTNININEIKKILRLPSFMLKYLLTKERINLIKKALGNIGEYKGLSNEILTKLSYAEKEKLYEILRIVIEKTKGVTGNDKLIKFYKELKSNFIKSK